MLITLIRALLPAGGNAEVKLGCQYLGMEDRAAVVESFEAIGEVSSADPRLDTSSVGHTQEAQVDVDVSTHAGDTEGGSRSGSNRLSSIVPTLGRMANTAHMLSTPYLTYAAMASQEAAR